MQSEPPTSSRPTMGAPNWNALQLYPCLNITSLEESSSWSQIMQLSNGYCTEKTQQESLSDGSLFFKIMKSTSSTKWEELKTMLMLSPAWPNEPKEGCTSELKFSWPSRSKKISSDKNTRKPIKDRQIQKIRFEETINIGPTSEHKSETSSRSMTPARSIKERRTIKPLYNQFPHPLTSFKDGE